MPSAGLARHGRACGGDGFEIVGAEFRLSSGAPLIRASRAEPLDAGRVRLLFGELPTIATLSRLFFFDVKLFGADGHEHTLTLQIGRDARVLLAAVLDPSP